MSRLSSTPTCPLFVTPKVTMCWKKSGSMKRLPKHIFLYCEFLRALKQDGIDFNHEHDTAFGVNATRPSLARTLLDHLTKPEELVKLEFEHNVNNGHIRYLAEHYATEFNCTPPLGTL